MNQNTTCAYCGVGCGLSVDFEKNKIFGNREHITNSGLVCLKGSQQLRYISKNRILAPLYRENRDSPFREISWDDAIDIIVRKIQATSSDKIGFYLSGQLLNEDYYVANKLAKGFIKTNHVDTNSRTCMASAVVGYKKSIGLDYVPLTQQDALDSDLYILIGANIAESHIVLHQKVRKAQKRGLKVVTIDPRKTKTAKTSDLHIAINSGGDIYFLNAVAKRLYQLGKFQPSLSLLGYGEYLQKLVNIDIDTNLERAGVSKEEFEQFIQLWINSENIVTSWTMGINQSINGVASNLAIINLHLLTGKIFKPKNGPLSLTGQPNAMGGREVGGLATTLAVHLDYTPENVKKVEEFWNTSGIPQQAGLTAFEMIERGNLDFLLVAHTDPVYHLPNRNLVEERFSNIGFIVELNSYTNSETSKFADMILPASPFGEKEGTQVNLDRVLNYQAPLYPKSGLSLQDWEIFAKIGQGLGYHNEFSYQNSEEVFNEYREMTKLSPDIDIYKTSYSQLKKSSFRWGEEFKFKKANIIFPDEVESFDKPSKEYPFQLLTGRLRDSWHSETKAGIGVDFCEISKIDSMKLGICDGEVVRLKSRYGEVECRAKITDTLREGYIFVPLHFREVNYLTSPEIDKTSKEPEYKAYIKVEKVG